MLPVVGTVCISISSIFINRCFTICYDVWRQPKLPSFTSSLAFDSTTYNKHLCAKFAQLQDFVHANLWKLDYIRRQGMTAIHCHNTLIWRHDLVVNTNSRKIESPFGRKMGIKSFVNVEITDGSRVRVVHINPIQHRHQPDAAETPPPNKVTEVSSGWNLSQKT